jgi:transposase-like protein
VPGLVQITPESLNKEIRRRTDVAGIVLAVVIRPVGAILTQQNDKWAESRR